MKEAAVLANSKRRRRRRRRLELDSRQSTVAGQSKVKEAGFCVCIIIKKHSTSFAFISMNDNECVCVFVHSNESTGLCKNASF